MEGKTVKESALVTSQLMMPSDSNPNWKDGTLEMGAINGGAILNLIDNLAGTVALRHCRSRVVTASIDQMNFFNPVHVGELLWLKSSINYTGKTSLEVGVRVETENLFSGEVKLTGSAHLTFVAIDESGKPMTVPRIIAETDIEKKRHEEAKIRKQERLERARREREKMTKQTK